MISDELFEGAQGRVVFSDYFWSVVGGEIARVLDDGGFYHQVGSFSWDRLQETLKTSSELFGSYMKSVVVSLDGMASGQMDAWLEDAMVQMLESQVRVVLVTSDWKMYLKINDMARTWAEPMCA
jgi:predicted component of type VI protein secretion system